MEQKIYWNRRQFIVNTGFAAGALMTSVCTSNTIAKEVKPLHTSIYVTLLPQRRAAIKIPVPELGQGVSTAFALILADEIGIEPLEVEATQAQAGAEYGGMAAAGSDSMADYIEPLRLAGAELRDRLSRAAANYFHVSPKQIEIKSSNASVRGSSEHISIYKLASSAAEITPSSQIQPRAFSDYPHVGGHMTLIDGAGLVTGSTRFGIDVQLPQMHFAAIKRCPLLGGRVKSFDDRLARKINGVIKVLELPPSGIPGNSYASTRGGVAVIASSSWVALKAKDALKVEWQAGSHAKESDNQVSQRLLAALQTAPDEVLRTHGKPAEVLSQANTLFTATYQLPFLAHQCLEPMNFTAKISADRVELHGSTQVPRTVQAAVAHYLKRPVAEIQVTPTRCGGGFGRRLAIDYAIEAVQLAQLDKQTIKLVCSREDDSYSDYYRAPSVHQLSAGLDQSGQIVAWRHHIATSSLRAHIANQAANQLAKYDVQGAAELALAVPNIEIAYSHRSVGLQCGSWRSVSHSSNTFAVNVFIDELANKMAIDPITLHRLLFAGNGLKTVKLPFSGRRGNEKTALDRYHRVCDAAAKAVNWSQRIKTEALGFAACRFKNTYCATVAEAVMVKGKAKISKITSVIDCGRAINLNGIQAQVEGAAMDGWASAFLWSQKIQHGRPQKLNFDTYPMPSIADAPEIETVILSSDQPISGAGEPPYPAVAPAIINALAKLTGERFRQLPINV